MHRQLLFFGKEWFNRRKAWKPLEKYFFEDILQDRSIGLILILSEKNKYLSTREPRFYKWMFQSKIEGQAGYKYPTFPVRILNA